MNSLLQMKLILIKIILLLEPTRIDSLREWQSICAILLLQMAVALIAEEIWETSITLAPLTKTRQAVSLSESTTMKAVAPDPPSLTHSEAV